MVQVNRRAVTRSKIAYGPATSQFGHLYLASDYLAPNDSAPNYSAPNYCAADGTGLPPRIRPVVLVHGGYWSTEFGLTISSAVARHYAESGALVWNVEYRRVGEPGGGWPATGRDVIAAIEALDGPVRAALEPPVRARVDWSSVGVVGHSAGGQLAIWSVARLGARTQSTRITTVVVQSAALDLVAAGAAGRTSVCELMGADYVQAPDRYRDASPIEQQPFDAHVVAIHGERDLMIPVEVSREYVRVAGARGQSTELIVIAGEGHDAFVDPRSAGNRQTMRVLGI
ncbi:MAG: alpha/beta hydrolase [Gordonia sp. (in: high G+C Gram-positive bacteria)]